MCLVMWKICWYKCYVSVLSVDEWEMLLFYIALLVSISSFLLPILTWIFIKTVAPRIQYFGSDDEDDQPLSKMIGHPNVSLITIISPSAFT